LFVIFNFVIFKVLASLKASVFLTFVKSDICLRGIIIHRELSDSHNSLTVIAKILRILDLDSHPFLESMGLLFYNFIRGIDKFHTVIDYHFPRKQEIRFDTTNFQPRLIAFIFRGYKDYNSPRKSVSYSSEELYERISLGDKIHYGGVSPVLIFRKGMKRPIQISSGSK